MKKLVLLNLLLFVGLASNVGCRSKSSSSDKLVENTPQTQPLTPTEEIYGIKITPETKIDTYYPNRQDYVNAPISYNESVTENAYHTYQYESLKTTPPCEYAGEIMVLARFESVEMPPASCVNGKRTSYIYCTTWKARILHVFTGNLKVGELIPIKAEEQIWNAYSFYENNQAPKTKAVVGLVSLFKNDDGKYIQTAFEFMWPKGVNPNKIIPPPKFISSSGRPIINHGVDLPKTFGELDIFFQDLVTHIETYCPRTDLKYIKRKTYLNCQETDNSGKEVDKKYIEGTPCDPEQDRIEDEKKRGIYIPTLEEIKADEDAQCEKLGCKVINGIRMIDDTGAFKKEQEEKKARLKTQKTTNHKNIKAE